MTFVILWDVASRNVPKGTTREASTVMHGLKDTGQQSILFAFGINHRTAPVEMRERIYVHPHEIPPLIAKLKETLDEAIVLSTCNRTEIYAVTSRTDLDLDFYKELLIDFKSARDTVSRDHFFGMVSCAACQQLFTIAASIDSKIIGDTQILGQLREAYALAKEHHATGKIIDQLFQRSFKTGKRARTETRLHKGAVSVSLAAVELAEGRLGGFGGKTVLLIGAGSTARLAAEALVKRRVGKLIVANRTTGNAVAMLEGLRKIELIDHEVVGLERLSEVVPLADVIISSTSSPDPILDRSLVARRKKDLLLLDLAVPRDVDEDVRELGHVELRNIDHLNEIVDRNYQRRMADIPLATRIVTNEMTDFLIWYYSLPLMPRTMRCGAKPDAATQREIVRVKEFLMSNLSQLHKMAMKDGAATFSGHAAVVDHLVEMKEAAWAAG